MRLVGSAFYRINFDGDLVPPPRQQLDQFELDHPVGLAL